MELSFNRNLLCNPIGGQMKSGIPRGRVEDLFSGAGLTLDSLYVSDILSSICNPRQLRARSQRSDRTIYRRLSVNFLPLFLSAVLQHLRHVARQLRCFLGLLLTVTSDQNSVYFSKAASTVSHAEVESRAATFQPPHAPHYSLKNGN